MIVEILLSAVALLALLYFMAPRVPGMSFPSPDRWGEIFDLITSML